MESMPIHVALQDCNLCAEDKALLYACLLFVRDALDKETGNSDEFTYLYGTINAERIKNEIVSQ